MIQLVLKNGYVVATHEMHQDVRGKYPGCEIVTFDGSLPPDDELLLPSDPRTEAEKKGAYKDKRRLAYPTIEEQLDMIYHDAVAGTAAWLDEITSVKEKFPKPAAEAE